MTEYNIMYLFISTHILVVYLHLKKNKNFEVIVSTVAGEEL